MFEQEAGGHRWQRVPPNERNGRVHTSTITVAILHEPKQQQLVIPENDLEITACRGSGNGGQHRNKTNSTIQIKHKPSGLMVRSEGERSQYQNKLIALEVLRSRLWFNMQTRMQGNQNQIRRQQLGSGQRGDKRRTIACQRGLVEDHVTGRIWQLADYLSGKWI